MDIERDPEYQPPIEVPRDALSDDAFRAIIESFIQREGTDYGREEVELKTKMHQIEKQLEKGTAKIVFDPNTETVSIVTIHEWNRMKKNS